MANRDTDQSEILQAVLDFYVQRLDVPKELVIPCIEPMTAPAAMPGGAFWLHVALGEGDFRLEEQDDEQLRETLELTVVGFTRMQLDRDSREHEFLFDKTRGVSAIKKKILLLVGEQLKSDEDGLLASRVYARRALKATYDPNQAVGWVGISFGVEFDWDMAGAGAEDLGDDN